MPITNISLRDFMYRNTSAKTSTDCSLNLTNMSHFQKAIQYNPPFFINTRKSSSLRNTSLLPSCL